MSKVEWAPMKSTEWQTFDISKIIIGDLYLCEVSHHNGTVSYQAGVFRLTGDGRPIGNIGGRFHFDCKITRVANIQHLVPEDTDE